MKRVFKRASFAGVAAFAVAGLFAAESRAGVNPFERLAQFGASVVVVGGDVLIGEPQSATGPGAVYVYRRDAGGWVAADTIMGESQGFGAAMAADGERVLIGSVSQLGGQPSAYMYERADDGAWRQVAVLTPRDSVSAGMFGYGVALRGDVALVSAPLADGQKGAVHVFRRGDAGWAHAGMFTASDAAQQTFFGVSLAFDGERALVTSPSRGVYAFVQENGAWRETGKVAPEGAPGGQAFGMSLVVRGDVALVGSPSSEEQRGMVYVFRADAAGAWKQAAAIAPPDTARRAFGAAVELSGDRLWVGAPNTGQGRGAIYAFARQPSGEWQQTGVLGAPDAQPRETFGSKIAVADNLLVAGMSGADFGAGKASIFEGGPEIWTHAAAVFTEEASYDPVTGKEIKCAENNGKAADFSCGDVDLLAFLPIKDIGGGRGVQLNDIWGWTDPQSGKEYALVGRVNGTSFVDISDPVHPVYVGDLPMTDGAQANAWRDIKVYKDHAFIVADGAGKHGVQVFDLAKLRAFTGQPITFQADTVYDKVFSAHNIVINEESGFAYSVGSGAGGETCGGGLHMIDIREPKHPKFAGCFADPMTGNQKTGYSHDAQCVTYKGPDQQYQGREICIGSNETHLSVADVTDKAGPKAISRAAYPNVSYTHQGWFTEDHRYFLVDDEGDEISGLVPKTRTLVWDMQDLDDPKLLKEFLGTTSASDHNLYIKGNLVYQSNYASGLRILDITDPANPVEVGFFDTVPAGENSPGFTGSWSNYPFFKSGVIAVSSIEQGLFLVRKAPTRRVIS
jgi:choice-of-anchor B domain-containing protein